MSGSASTDAATVLRGFIDVVWNARRVDRFGEFVHPDVRFHPPRGDPRDLAGYREMATHFLAAFPDLHFAIEETVPSGDRASARLTITGTNGGPFRGRPPTGRRVRVIGHPHCRVLDGRIIEFHQLFDELGMLHQLGHVTDGSLLGAPMTRPEAP